jgi:hypothetical protein
MAVVILAMILVVQLVLTVLVLDHAVVHAVILRMDTHALGSGDLK